MDGVALKGKLKTVEAQLPKPAQIRLHRAISWLRRAESEKDDSDAQFVFLWISFNAAYAQELGPDLGERDQLTDFFKRLLEVDHAKRIHGILFERFTGPIRTLVENKFVFEPFWRALREHDSSNRWEGQFTGSKKAALAAIMGGDTLRVLAIVFDRLYVLRNQIVHGGATWNSSVNRAQVKDGTTILLSVIPHLIDLMLDQPQLDWGDINYPVV